MNVDMHLFMLPVYIIMLHVYIIYLACGRGGDIIQCSSKQCMLWYTHSCLRKHSNFIGVGSLSSPELKAQMSYSDHLLSVVCPHACRPSVNCSLSHFLLKNKTTTTKNTGLISKQTCVEGVQVYTEMKGHVHSMGR